MLTVFGNCPACGSKNFDLIEVVEGPYAGHYRVNCRNTDCPDPFAAQRLLIRTGCMLDVDDESPPLGEQVHQHRERHQPVRPIRPERQPACPLRHRGNPATPVTTTRRQQVDRRPNYQQDTPTKRHACHLIQSGLPLIQHLNAAQNHSL